jgi:hypothetical protein
MRLQSLIERYIAYHQALGESFKTNAIVLRAFGRAIGARAALAARWGQASPGFPDGKGPITSAWFGRHAPCSGSITTPSRAVTLAVSPLPRCCRNGHRPSSRTSTPRTSYAVCFGDGLLPAAAQQHEPITMRVLILLLYGAGLCLQEAIALDRADVDIENLLLTLRHAKFSKTRLVPLSPKLGTPCRVRPPAGTAWSRSRGSILHDARARG